ncbi:MAG: hypothetical protein ACOC53_05390 [Candidatus Saliniplasma sp.]
MDILGADTISIKRRDLVLLGIFLVLVGGWLTGAIQKFMTGDTMTYLKHGMGYAGSAAGLLIIEHALMRGGDTK